VASTARDAAGEVGGVMVELRERSRVAALPTWLLLGGIVAVSFFVRALYALRDPAPWIFHDEIAYSELAKSFGYGGEFAIRDVAGTGGFGVLYPILIAPAFALFDGVPDAYDALRLINCLLVSLTAVPVYLIGRRVAGRWLALAAAALSLAIPSLMYTGTVMTENAFYPATAFFGLALVRALERPTLLRQLLVFAVLGVAFLIRAQAVVFVAVLGTALAAVVLLDALADRGPLLARLRRAALPFWPTLALLALGAVALPVRQLLQGEPLTAVLGAYGGITELGYDWAAVGEYLLYHLAELDILVGVFPLAAFIAFVLWALRPSQPRSLRVFGAVAASLVVWFVVVAAAYGSAPIATRIVERNMFHVVPFVFLAFVAWIRQGLPRPWWAAAPAALFAATLTLGLPLNSFLNGTVVHSTAGLIPIWRWRDRLFSPGSIDEVVFVAAVLGALAFLLAPRRLAPLLLLVLMAYYVAAARPVEGFTHGASVGSYEFGVGPGPTDWIDRRVDADVGSFWWAGANAVPYWESEFFNRRVKRVYSLSGPYDGLTHTFTYLTVRPSGALVDLAGRPVHERYVLTDRGTRLRGAVVAQNTRADLVVYRLEGALSARERIEGLYADDWSGAGFSYRRYACRGGSLALSLVNDPLIHPRRFAVRVRVSGDKTRELRFTPRRSRYAVRIPLVASDGVCQVELSMPTGSALVYGKNDPRLLGLRFDRVRYVPSR
jgi:hypothetical protein